MNRHDTFNIGNGVNLNLFSSANLSSKTLNIPNNAYVIGMVRRLVVETGVVDFLDAACIASRMNSNLWMLG